MDKKQSFTFVILGGGGRGNCFSEWIKTHPEAGKVVAIAEPQAERRNKIAEAHGIPANMQFERWEDLLAKPKLADVCIDTLMDRLHMPSATKALGLGYHMLLEKPMATSLEDCIAIDKARRDNNRIVCICHSMRYAETFYEIKRILDSGAIGKLVTFDQLEAVEHIHQSHSFVRGNWGNESRSTFMLMAKSCHDIDYISWLVGKPCKRVSSFGSLSYFRKENAPPGATEQCTGGCAVEHSCPYSSIKIYLAHEPHWVAWHAGIAGKPYEERLAALKKSPFDKCVFQTDNDVVDHQVVAFEFEDGITGTFTMTAFTPFGGRFVRLHGTHGYIQSDTDKGTIDVHRHADRKHDHIKIPPRSGSHGGADDNVMRSLIHALRQNDPNLVLTGTAESLRTHTVVFAAEKSRREKRTVELSELEVRK